MDAMMNRRSFSGRALASLSTLALLESVVDVLGSEVRPVVVNWLKDVNDLSRSVKGQAISQVEWQKKTEDLFGKVSLPELLRFIDFERLTRQLSLPAVGARSVQFRFPKVEGLPTEWIFGKQIFVMTKGHSVVPHGHNNMATAFLILDGDFRGRHYDRLGEEADYYLIRPTIDRRFTPGEHSSVSDFKDNVHWFVAESDRAAIFNIHVLGVRPDNTAPTGRLYLDPMGTKGGDGLIRAKKLDYTTAHKLYG